MGKLLATLEGCEIRQEDDGRVHFEADADIDADGANGQSISPTTHKPVFAYSPADSGIDLLRNAGYPNGSYRDILICSASGRPVLFGNGYASKTAWHDKAKASNDPTAYLDSVSVPYIVIEGFIRRRAKGIVLGCKARVTYKGQSVDAVVGDIGPLYKIGEVSIAAADAIHIPSNPKTGGVGSGVTYELWPGVPAVINGTVYDLISSRGE